MKKNKILKEAGVLLIVMVMVFSSTAAIANTVKDLEPEIDVECKEVWLGNNPSAPMSMADAWLYYDDGGVESVFGTSSPPFWIAIRMNETELAPYDGWEIVESAWYHYVYNQSIPTHDYEIWLAEGNLTHVQTIIVNENDIATIPDGWEYHTFTNTYTIDKSKDLWIVAKIFCFNASATEDYCIGHDTTAASYVAGKSALYHTAYGGQDDSSPFGDMGSSYGAWCLRVRAVQPPPTPVLSVNVTGGFGLTATVTNSGDTDATIVTADFTLTGGFFLLPPGGSKSVAVGTVAKAGGTGTAKCMVFGIGKPTVTVNVTCDEGVTASGTYTPTFVILFFVL